MPEAPATSVVTYRGLRARARTSESLPGTGAGRGASKIRWKRTTSRQDRRFYQIAPRRRVRGSDLSALDKILADSNVSSTTKLVVIPQPHGVLITAEMPAAAARFSGDNLVFESCLAEILVKRESALRRLAE